MTGHQLIVVSFCAVIAAGAVWALHRAARTGKISSRGWTFDLEESPGWFLLVVVCDVIILVGAVWFALHTAGVVETSPLQLFRD